MAVKGKSEATERSNRFRFVMLDADLSDANVNALAQAIVSALKPEAAPVAKRIPGVVTTVANRLRAPAATPANGNGAPDESAIEPEPAVETTNDADAPAAETSGSSPSTRSRKGAAKPAQPTYVDNLFPSTTEADAFKAFAAEHPTNKHSERYLVAALYLRDHGRHPTVTLHDIYTCYRLAGWPMTVNGTNDWDINLRNQVRNDRFRRVDGGYSITTAGEGIVQQLRAKS
jgi:hypothetical protein